MERRHVDGRGQGSSLSSQLDGLPRVPHGGWRVCSRRVQETLILSFLYTLSLRKDELKRTVLKRLKVMCIVWSTCKYSQIYFPFQNMCLLRFNSVKVFFHFWLSGSQFPRETFRALVIALTVTILAWQESEISNLKSGNLQPDLVTTKVRAHPCEAPRAKDPILKFMSLARYIKSPRKL